MTELDMIAKLTRALKGLVILAAPDVTSITGSEIKAIFETVADELRAVDDHLVSLGYTIDKDPDTIPGCNQSDLAKQSTD